MVYFGFLVIGIAVTDAVFMSVMMLLVIPGTYLSDWICHHVSIAWPAVIGSILIVLGALLLDISVLDCVSDSKRKESYVQMGKGSKLRSSVLRECSTR